MNSVELLLADDHKILRDGLRAMLEGKKDYHICGEASSGREVLEFCALKPVDLVLMDLNMPDLGGVQTTRKLHEEHPEIKILALSVVEETATIRSAVEAGASGFLLKNAGLNELLSAMETVMQGNSYFSSKAAHSLVQGTLEDENHATEELTERETEILLLICREMTNPEIADQLFLSVRTIDAHRRNILQKTGARNTAGLVAYAHRHGLSGS